MWRGDRAGGYGVRTLRRDVAACLPDVRARVVGRPEPANQGGASVIDKGLLLSLGILFVLFLAAKRGW